MFEIGNALRKLFGREDRPAPMPVRRQQSPQMLVPEEQQRQAQAPQGPLRTDPGFHRMQGGTLINNGTFRGGRRLYEDELTFPNGGQFQPMGGGRAYINRGWAPGGTFEEDQFDFSAEDRLRRMLGG